MGAEKPLLVVIAGPTASGKTAVSTELAQHYSTEVVSADSRQLFKEMKIGTARPDAGELKGVPHHLLGSHSIFDKMTAGIYAREALETLDRIFSRKPIAFLVGGTGLYIQAVTHGLDELPRNRQKQESLNKEFHEKGLEYLVARLKELDAETANRIDLNNPLRVIRALEVTELSGQPMSQLMKGQKSHPRPFRVIEAGIMPPREQLYQRINQRVDEMMVAGLLDECRELFAHRNLNALRTVGYREIFDHLEKKTTLERAVELVKQHSRNYAKRQMTWIRRSGAVQVEPDAMEIRRLIDRELAK